MSFLEGETNVSPYSIYQDIIHEKFNKMNEKIKQHEQIIDLKDAANRRYYLKCCFEGIISSKDIRNNYVFGNIILEKGNIDDIDEKVIKQDILKKLFSQFKINFEKQITKEKTEPNLELDDKHRNEPSLQNNENENDILPKINTQLKFLSKIYYLYKDKIELINFILQEIINSDKIENKIDSMKAFFDNKDNFEKNEFKTLEEVKFFIRLFLEINYLTGVIEYSFQNNFVIKRINQEINKILYLKEFLTIFNIQKNQEIIKEMSDIIYQIYSISDKIKDLINECKDRFEYNISENINIIHLLKYIIIQSEKDYIINIKPHSLLCKKSIIKINIEEKKDQLKDLYFYGNNTLKDIYRNLTKKNNSKNIVYYNMNDISENDEQYKSLNELDKKGLFKISKKEIEKNISMLLIDGSLTQKFKDILKSWFSYFSKGKDQMTKSDLVECFNALTDKKPKKFTEKSYKISFFLKKYSGNLNSIIMDKFINYYYIKTSKGINENVWMNLENMNFRSDLSKIPQIKENKFLPRYYLSNETEENKDMNFMNIFKEKYKTSTNKEMYDLMFFLSTDEKLYDYILSNFNKDKNMKFTKRHDEYLYNLYIINIIISIFEDVELKNNKSDKLKDILICENEYDLYKSGNKIKLKNKFVVDFIKNNYSDLIEFTINNLEKIGEMQDEKDIEKLFIIIKLNEKCLELIHRIYFYYHNIPNEGLITLGKCSLKEFIEANNLSKEIKAEEKYKDLILQIMKFFDKYYLSDNKIYDKIKYSYDISFYLLISLLFEKKDIFDDVMNNEEKKNLFNKILNYILMQEKQKNNKFYLQNLYKINLSIVEIHIFLIDLSFSILKSLDVKKLEPLLSLFIRKILNSGLNSENKKIKEEILSLLHNYIKNDFNDVKLGVFLQVFGKILEEQNKSKINIMEEKYNNTNLYELIYGKIIKKEEEILKNKYQKYEDMKNFLNSGIEKEKYIEYDIVKKKIDELFKTSNNDEKNINNEQNKSLTESLITFFKSYINKNTKNNKIIPKILSSLKKLVEKEADQFKFDSSESSTPDPNSNLNSQENKIKKSSPYTGIRNLGALCYLGSIIQQLFWIPKFRYSILSVDDLKPVDKSYEHTDDDNTLHQIQKLYTYLLLSSYGEVIPKNFIFSIKVFEERVNIRQMLDSSEFYLNFCDIIHNSLEKTKYKTLIEDLFCGKTQEKRICSNCSNTSSKEEEFKQISLEVKDKKDLYESLDQYISEEIIDDYKCDKCNNKVKLKKSSMFYSLPNILVFHLKRIIFNNMGDMVKIYSKFDFPINDLNIKKYCIISNSDNNKNDDYYKYNLIGINIHKGTAEGGHYINLIKTSKEENKWYLFDDSHVEEYDFKNFDDDFNKSDKKTNTYILFYEAVKEKQTKFPNEKLMNKKYLIDVFNDNKMYDYLYGNKIIDIKNNLIQLMCDILNNDSFKLKEKNLTYFELLELLNILIKLFINFYSLEKTRNNPEEKDIKNLVNIINKVFIPIVQEDNIANENNNKLHLIREIMQKLFSDKNIKLFFTNKPIKDLNEKLYELIHLIIEENKKEDEDIFKKNDFQETISFIISRQKKLSKQLYKIFYELITFNPNASLIHIDENSFIDLFYGVREEENPENYKDISNIFEYYIDKKNILEKNEKINKVLIEDLNDSLIILLFDESKNTLIKLIQKIQHNNKEISDMFNLDVIQKLYNYCLKDKSKIKEKQIKLIQLIFDILDIKDRYVGYRTRLLLGFPTLVMQSSDNTIINKFGINILDNDINKEIYEYSNYNLIKKDRCVLSYLFPSMYYKNEENKLEESEKCDLIYELINRSLGLNENKEGNYFLFKTLYLMQSRSIQYDNLYQEMKSILEKTGNNKYDLNKINQAEKEVIQLVNYEFENLKKTITKHNAGNNEKKDSKPNLPEQYNKWEELLNLNFNVDYIGCVSNIFPNEIGKIEIITKLDNKKLRVLRFKIYTTYFTKQELFTLSRQNKPFTYENVERGSPSIDNKKEKVKILDYSIFQEKKDLKEFISYIIELLKENGKVIIENKDIINKYEIKNTLNKFYVLNYDKKTVIKSQLTHGDMFLDEINNFYLPEYIYNSVEENQAINLFNVHSLNNEYKFFESNDIGISLKCAKYDKYYKDIFK